MKWFFALNELGNAYNDYAEMLKVAVHTARKFTSLEPHFVYDGQPNELTDWLSARGVRIIQRRSFLYHDLKRIADARGQPQILAIGAGAFLRTELPRLTEELGIEDRYVLYTDVDVMFCSEVDADFAVMAPKYFAVAPEFHQDNYRDMNSGVMVMNLTALRRRDAQFRRFMVKELDMLVDNTWDQTAYRIFYKTWRSRLSSRFRGYLWDELPSQYNWKAYWPESSRAKIIHFHGPKPYMKNLLASGDLPESMKATFLPLNTPSYVRLTAVWSDAYAEAVGT